MRGSVEVAGHVVGHVVVIGNDADIGGGDWVSKRGGEETGVARPALAFGQDDFGGTNSLGRERAVEVGNEIVKLGAVPDGGLVAGDIGVGFVLDGEVVVGDACGGGNEILV